MLRPSTFSKMTKRPIRCHTRGLQANMYTTLSQASELLQAGWPAQFNARPPYGKHLLRRWRWHSSGWGGMPVKELTPSPCPAWEGRRGWPARSEL